MHVGKCTESLRLEKTFEILECNSQPMATIITPEPYPQVLHIHTHIDIYIHINVYKVLKYWNCFDEAHWVIAVHLITSCSPNAARLRRVCSHQLTKESSLLQQIPALMIGVERSLIYLE